MEKKYSNPCSRCGTERIMLRTWTEKTENSTVVNREMICPNPKCQQEVIKDNKIQADKYSSWKRRGKERAVERKRVLQEIRKKKKK